MVKLNLGCGPHAMDGWINYDLTTGGNPTIRPLDLSLGHLPHADASVDFIFSEHFIEHITKEQGLKLLAECYRVLKPHGVLRISTPDLAQLLDCYERGEVETIPGTWEPKSVCDMVNEGMRLWGHQYLWDMVELACGLSECGFKKIFSVNRCFSDYPELEKLEVRPQHFEMYFEATK